jgi:hypothetical protein
MDEAIVGLGSLLVRFTSLGITDDAAERELGYHGVSLACTVNIVSDPGGAVRVASASDAPCLERQLAVPPVAVHCSSELTNEQLSLTTYVPVIFIAATEAERQRQSDEALRNAPPPEPTASEALAAARKELMAVAEGSAAAVEAPPQATLGAAKKVHLEPSLAVNVALWLEKPSGNGTRTNRVHITTHQSTFSAVVLKVQDAAARFAFTRAELSAAMKELLGSHRSASLDGEESIGQTAGLASPGGSVAVNLFFVSLTPLVRMLASAPEMEMSFRSRAGSSSSSSAAPWPLELVPDGDNDWSADRGSAGLPRLRHQLLKYGDMPLYELHRHTRLFFDLSRRVTAKIRSDQTMGPLFASPPAAALRWELLRDLDLSKLLLGDRRLVPVLAVVSVASALRYLNVDRNELSLVSAKRLHVVLSSTPHRLERLSCTHNNFLESSGEELLRVVRASKHLWRVDCDGNSFSPRLSERIAHAAEYNASLMKADPYYVLASTHLTSWECMPAEALHAAKAVWMMLVVGEGRPFEESRRAARERSECQGGDLVMTSHSTPAPAASGDSSNSGSTLGGSSCPSSNTRLYPLEVVAPLFSQVARIVAFNMFKVISDPLIRQVFTPVSALETDEERTASYATSYYKIITIAMRCVLHTPQWWDSAAATLHAIGEAHERLGVSHLYYSMANKLFVEAISTLCGEDVFTAVHKAALVQFLALATLTALQGTESFA